VVSNTSKLLAVAVTVSACFGFVADVAEASQQKLEATHNVVIAEEHINNKSYQVTRMTIKARPEQVWQVLTDYSSAPKIFPTLKRCRVINDNGATKRIHYQIHPSGIMTCFEYDLEVHETPHKMIEWRKLSGDFKEVTGFWKLEPAEGGRATAVTYASHVNGGLFIPQGLIKRQTRIDFPQVMAALKHNAENTTQVAVRAQHSHSAN
jgi:ribosome-associated toxin RatA of RatAB toxin-antitoxin module